MEEKTTKEILQEVFELLVAGNYDATSQIVGYLNSGDPGYVSSYKGAREKIIALDRYALIEIMLKEFLRK